MVISTAPKHNPHAIGYQLGDQRKNNRMGRQKENGMVRPNLVFLPLNLTFRSRGYINFNLSGKDGDIVTPLLTLTINVITEEEETVENARSTVYPCPLDFELNN